MNEQDIQTIIGGYRGTIIGIHSSIPCVSPVSSKVLSHRFNSSGFNERDCYDSMQGNRGKNLPAVILTLP